MADGEHNPAAMLEAALNGELTLDGDQVNEQPKSDEEVKPGQSAQDDATEGAKQGDATAKADDEPHGAPIASKSGAYTIPYEKLSQARAESAQFKAENEQLKAQLEQLTAAQKANLEQANNEAKARADAGAGQTAADLDLALAQAAISEGVDPSIFGDFSEQGLANGSRILAQQMAKQQAIAIREELKAELQKELAPFKQVQVKTAADAHMGAIYEKHADADELVESGEFKTWIASLPSFSRAGVEKALQAGTTEQVIEVFDSFKAVSGKPAPIPRPALDVQRRVPTSLSEIAGGSPVDVTQQTLAMSGNPMGLLDRMASMTPEQMDAVMNRV